MEFKHPNRSFVAFVLTFIFVIVVGLLTLNWPDLKYALSPEETIEQIVLDEYSFFPEDLVGIIEYEDSAFVIIDLRNPYEYIKGHINGAINMPVNSILNKENLKAFKQYEADSLTVVLYGETQLDANGPWIILRQMGYKNLKVLLGGYHYFTTGPLDFYEMPEVPEYLAEEPKYDFYGTMETLGSISYEEAEAGSQTEVVIPTRKKKTSVVEGGC